MPRLDRNGILCKDGSFTGHYEIKYRTMRWHKFHFEKLKNDMEPEDIAQSFRILRKCQNKFDCLIFEMFFIQELKPTLNKQCDSIRAKLFV